MVQFKLLLIGQNVQQWNQSGTQISSQSVVLHCPAHNASNVWHVQRDHAKMNTKTFVKNYNTYITK